MSDVNKCPLCYKYIMGTYCCNCMVDIREVANKFNDNPLETFFKDIFKGDNNA